MSPQPYIVGIAGGSASGKTTISNKLAAQLAPLRSVHVFHMDTYFKKDKPTMLAPITGEQFSDHNHPESFELDQLVADLDALCAQGEHQVIIVEGLMTLHHAPLRERLDLRIFLDAPSDERIVRRMKRSLERGGTYDEIARFFLDSVRFRHQEFVEPSRWHADLVLNGSYPSEKGLRVVAEWILSHSDGTPAP